MPELTPTPRPASQPVSLDHDTLCLLMAHAAGRDVRKLIDDANARIETELAGLLAVGITGEVR